MMDKELKHWLKTYFLDILCGMIFWSIIFAILYLISTSVKYKFLFFRILKCYFVFIGKRRCFSPLRVRKGVISPINSLNLYYSALL